MTTEAQAKWYDETFTRMGGVWLVSTEELDTHLDRAGVERHNERSQMLLDIGCGDGSLCLRALEREHVWTWGIDLSEVAIQWAMDKREKLDGAQYRHSQFMMGDVAQVMKRFPEQSFDFIVSLGSLEHVIDIETTLEHVHRCLRPNGSWYFYVPNEKWPHRDQPTERQGTEQEWQGLFANHGLETGQVWPFGDCSAFKGVRAND